MSSSNNERLQSPSEFTYSFVSEFGISPISTLSANLGSNLHIRRNLVFSSNDNTPVKAETDENPAANLCTGSPTTRMVKHKSTSGAGGSPTTGGSRFSFSRRLNSSKTCTDKENASGRRSFSMDFSLMSRGEVSPSKFAITRQIWRERNPLEDHDPNSQDSGYSNSSSSFSEDSKSSSANFRFAEPNGVPPRRTYTMEFSPGRDSLSPQMKRQAMSPRYRKRLQHRMSTDSMFSDFSDDGFGENAVLPSDGSSLMERDENVKLPPDFNSLLSGPIYNLSKITESPAVPAEESFLQASLRRSLSENITPKRIAVRASAVDADMNEMMFLEKDAVKRTAAAVHDKESGFSIKRRKSSPKLKVSCARPSLMRSWSTSIAATAPVASCQGTLFNYGFKKTSAKFQRSFSETEATIKNAVQKATLDSNLIGDYSKPFVLPSEMAQCGNTRMAYMNCDTLAKLMTGGYDDIISSYTIIDCRYTYEFEGGHIQGAINISTEEQMNLELKENNFIYKPSPDSAQSVSSKRDILIFHCEFSSKRGPKMVKYVRNEDRNKNFSQYPKLDYPEIYLLQGGYSKFYKHHKNLCDPCGYRPMVPADCPVRANLKAE